MTMRGSCLCGAVRLEADASKWCAHCHCSMCRRAHGAGHVLWVGLDEGAFRIVSGAETLGRYASSPGAERSFCTRCGTPMLFRSQRWPGEVHVAGALLDALDRAPQAHVFWDDRASFTVCEDGLPRRGGKTGVEKG